MKKLEEKLFSFIAAHDLIKSKEKLLVGFSGGPDSVFCLNFLNKYKKKYNIELAAVHVNHNIRKSCIHDVDFCRKFCEKNKIKFFYESVNVMNFAKKHKISTEEAGRILRYDVFEKIASENLHDKIVTAHNLDDNAETVLLNFIKGSGVNGLKGIPIQRGNIIRPMLCLGKKDIFEYLMSKKISYVNDETNQSNEYQRNYLRNEIIPKLQKNLNRNFAEAVSNLSANVRELSLYLDNEIYAFINNNIVSSEDNCSIFVTDIKKLPPFVFSEVIRNFFIDNLKIGFVKSDLTKIRKLLVSQKGKHYQFRKAWECIRENDSLHFAKKDYLSPKNSAVIEVGEEIKYGDFKLKIELVSQNEVNFKSDGKTEFIDADKISGKFIVRKWKSGDKFVPLGMKHFKKVSDFLTDLKLSTSAKKNTCVMLNRNNIVWIVGLRIDDNYRIEAKSRKINRLRVSYD